MSEQEKQNNSQNGTKRKKLATKIFTRVALGSVILALLNMVAGIGLYTASLLDVYRREGYSLASNIADTLGKELKLAPFINEVMDVYHSLSPEERENPESEAYLNHFSSVKRTNDYAKAMSIITKSDRSYEGGEIYLAVYDPKTESVLYIADPQQSDRIVHSTGAWESVSKKELREFVYFDEDERPNYTEYVPGYGWIYTTGFPIPRISNEYQAYVLTEVHLNSPIKRARAFFLQFLGITLVLAAILAYRISQKLNKAVVKPIREISQAAIDYVEDKKDGVEDERHFTVLQIHTGDEIEDLVDVMSNMEVELNEYETNLTRVTAEKQRIHTELSLANRIQADMLPNIFPAFPDRKDFDIYASMSPAKEVGGDFYDYFLIDDTHLVLVMADVSGKGIPAALFMMASKSMIQNQVVNGRSPADVLENVNEQICQNNREDMFVTIWLGILDLTNGRLIASNAGHEYPMISEAGQPFRIFKDPHGFVIGGMEGVRFRNYEIRMEPGTKLFLYTDGAPEATDENDRMFGTERMLQVLRGTDGMNVQQILEYMGASVRAFSGSAAQFDDLTMLCIEYFGAGGVNGTDSGNRAGGGNGTDSRNGTGGESGTGEEQKA